MNNSCKSRVSCTTIGIMMENVFACDYMKRICKVLYFFNREDASSALEAFSLVVKQFQKAPKVNELFLVCVQREDPESLQKGQ